MSSFYFTVLLFAKLTFILSFQVPVFDGRQVKDNFKWTAEVFNHLEVHFPRWDKEIPKHSCVIVGYIVNFMSATGGREWKMYNNIQWAIMLGSPS